MMEAPAVANASNNYPDIFTIFSPTIVTNWSLHNFRHTFQFSQRNDINNDSTTVNEQACILFMHKIET